jgi:hypothetical protein
MVPLGYDGLTGDAALEQLRGAFFDLKHPSLDVNQRSYAQLSWRRRMKGAVPFVPVGLLLVFVLLSCPSGPNLSHESTIVNNSSRAIERVGLAYTRIKAAQPDFDIGMTVNAGQTKTVELTLDSSSEFYILFIWNDTDGKSIVWDGGAVGYEYVLLSKNGSSTCTVTDAQVTTFAGQNDVIPCSHDWN